ncbi:hypothetical protein PVAP13_7KG317723 [Panicum virgatum]|uniref:Uncharacterized protein n=1 Tax=Panicum virgatum TaxID=38727 RepID=A0A8T0QL50_PANVG|nr:hypothetical protein PVAP13_7KG317723 [Panicum virgatum]
MKGYRFIRLSAVDTASLRAGFPHAKASAVAAVREAATWHGACLRPLLPSIPPAPGSSLPLGRRSARAGPPLRHDACRHGRGPRSALHGGRRRTAARRGGGAALAHGPPPLEQGQGRRGKAQPAELATEGQRGEEGREEGRRSSWRGREEGPPRSRGGPAAGSRGGRGREEGPPPRPAAAAPSSPASRRSGARLRVAAAPSSPARGDALTAVGAGEEPGAVSRARRRAIMPAQQGKGGSRGTPSAAPPRRGRCAEEGREGGREGERERERERVGREGRCSGGRRSGEERRGLRHGRRPGRGGRSGEDDGGARSGRRAAQAAPAAPPRGGVGRRASSRPPRHGHEGAGAAEGCARPAWEEGGGGVPAEAAPPRRAMAAWRGSREEREGGKAEKGPACRTRALACRLPPPWPRARGRGRKPRGACAGAMATGPSSEHRHGRRGAQAAASPWPPRDGLRTEGGRPPLRSRGRGRPSSRRRELEGGGRRPPPPRPDLASASQGPPSEEEEVDGGGGRGRRGAVAEGEREGPRWERESGDGG